MKKSRYISIESTACFSFSNLVQKVKAKLRKEYGDASEEEFSNLMYRSLKNFKLNDQTFDYVPQKNHLGGVRWYVKCPRCGNKCLKLYLPNKHKDRDQLYLCKNCHGLKNSSSLLGATKKYQNVVKPLKKLEKIRKELHKKGIDPEKATMLIEEYDRIETKLKNNREYRILKFRQEHPLPGERGLIIF